jgi:hypothetical protein
MKELKDILNDDRANDAALLDRVMQLTSYGENVPTIAGRLGISTGDAFLVSTAARLRWTAR